jgi:nitroreductase
VSEGFDQLDAALAGRKSVRGFRPEPLSRATLDHLFGAAQRAPSRCNIQPWRVVVTAPPLTGQVAEALIAAATSGMPTPDVPFPMDYPEPYSTHRRRCGGALYGAMGIARDDKASRYDAWLRNYGLFGAPHMAVVSHDRRLGQYATLDVGVWLGVLIAAAATLGVDLCPMASVAAYPTPLRSLLDIPDDELILFGMALGTEDPAVPANACRTTRDPLSANIRFAGFEA